MFGFIRDFIYLHIKKHKFQTMLIKSKGYPAEEHDVVTDDGYIINIQRIPHGIKGKEGN